ncbi:MAG: glycosyltransferase [Chitinophagaceae bacterium]|nr:glycosyltransferase [Chitinophagaceae bacterium]
MKESSLNIVILGLSITSSWGNGHATTFRGLVRELNKKSHRIIFLERDVPWYANNRDLPNPPFCKTELYSSIDELKQKFTELIRNADLVMVGSYVPEGVAIGNFVIETAEGISAFYDIDTPVTLSKIEKDDFEYLHPQQIPKYDLYLSFTGGPTLKRLEKFYGSPMARAFYCSFDPELYFPEVQRPRWDLGYLGTYSIDRQKSLGILMLDAAKKFAEGKFAVAGPQYPLDIQWPQNVQRIEHLPPMEHRHFYNQQRFTLNITRTDMIKAGYSPSVRLFEAAACATPVISDYWDGIGSIFEIGTEILISKSAEDTIRFLSEMSEEERKNIGAKAREKALNNHTAAHRATELETYYKEALWKKSPQPQAMED